MSNDTTVLICGQCGFGTYHWTTGDMWACNACDHEMHVSDFVLDAGESLTELPEGLAVVHGGEQ